MNINNNTFNSTYGLNYDFSFKGEIFYSISSSWRLASRPILKIRVANWKPKVDRNNQAIFYYDVSKDTDAKNILDLYKDFNFVEIENEFEKMWNEDNFKNKGYFNTGETDTWWNTKFLPYIRDKYKKPNHETNK